MRTKLILDAASEQSKLAVIEGDEVCEFELEHEQSGRLAGNIYVGKIDSVLPGIKAAFVDIGWGKNAYMAAEDASGPMKAGQEVVVQVVREAVGTKGPRVSTFVNLPGRYVVLSLNNEHIGVSKRITDLDERERFIRIARERLPENCGAIIRTVMHEGCDDDLIRDIDFLLSLKKRIDSRLASGPVPRLVHSDLSLWQRTIRDRLNDDVEKLVVCDRATFDEIYAFVADTLPQYLRKLSYYDKDYDMFEFYGISTALARLHDRKVWLACGGYLVIDKTEALTVIDVNTGKFTGRTDMEKTIFHANIEAAAEIAKQLRLRNVGGIIIVDFINMKSAENKEKVLEHLETCLDKDRTRADVVGMTRLGLVEITRKKS